MGRVTLTLPHQIVELFSLHNQAYSYSGIRVKITPEHSPYLVFMWRCPKMLLIMLSIYCSQNFIGTGKLKTENKEAFLGDLQSVLSHCAQKIECAKRAT